MKLRHLAVALAIMLLVGTLLALRLEAQQSPVIGTALLGAFPGALAVDEQSGRAFVVNYLDTTVSVVDTGNAALSTTRTIGSNGGAHPEAVAVDERAGHAFVTSDDGELSMLDARSGNVIRAVTLAYSAEALAVDERTAHLFATQIDNGSVVLADTRTGSVLRVVRVGSYPAGVAVDQETGRVFVTNESDGTVSMLDAGTGAVLHTTHVGPLPQGVLVSAPLGRAYVTNTGDGSISILDASRNTLLRTIHQPHQGRYGAGSRIAVDAHTGRLFFGTGRQIRILDARTGAIIRVIHLTTLITTMAVIPQQDLILAATLGATDPYGHLLSNGTVYVLDAENGAIRHTSDVQAGPGAIGVDERRDRALIVNTNMNPNGSVATVPMPQSSWSPALAWLRARLPGLGNPPQPFNGLGSLTVLDTSRL